MKKVEIGIVVEIIVIFAIASELFTLYNHTKLDKRIDEHILKNTENLIKNDTIMKNLNRYMLKVDQHILKLDDQIRNYDTHVVRLNEHVDDLDDLIMKVYHQNL